MALLGLEISGELWQRKDCSILVIRSTGSQLILRFPFETLRSEELIFPELLIDDWGREIAHLGLYRWVYENGAHFPRAEIFGRDMAGKRSQHFLREVELASTLPCFAYENGQLPLASGTRIGAIVKQELHMEAIAPAKPAANMTWPLQAVRARWWAINPDFNTETFEDTDFSFLCEPGADS